MSVQGTEAWRLERCGRVTASRVSDVIAKTKTGYGASRANYMAELAAERLTGVPAEGFVNKPMQWGLDHEAEARSAYEFYHDVVVGQVGFIQHPAIALSGASPDGLVGMDGGVEVKCPNTATHIETLLGKPVDDRYLVQVQWQMACAGRQWIDWCSYDPRMPVPLRLFTKRIPRDNARIAELEAEVGKFLDELAVKTGMLAELVRKAA